MFLEPYSTPSRGEGSGSNRKNLCDGLLASLKVEEAANRRFEAATWIQSMVGSNLDIPCEPSEEELRLCLKNGIILCNLLKKVKPGAVSKIVANHSSLSAYQYFENINNFLAAIKEMKLPTFQASQLEQEISQLGSITKIVDCILALKAYYEWKQLEENGAPLRTPMVMVPRETLNLLQHSTPCVEITNPSVRNMDSSGCKVSPEPDSYGETILKSAERFASVEVGVAPLNKESREVRELKEQVDRLNALERKEAEVKQLLNLKMKPSPYKELHTLVSQESVMSKVMLQNGNCNCEMVSHDGKLVDYGENNEMAEGKPNGNPLSSLGNELKHLTSTNNFWIGLCTSVVFSVIFVMLKR